MARPSTYTPELAEAVLARLEQGEHLVSICRDEALPSRRTVLRWVQSVDGFADEYHLARWAAAEGFDAEAKDLIDGIKDKDTAQAARAKFEILRWRAGVHAPRVYGDRIDLNVEHTFDLAGELARRRQQVIEANERLGIAAPEDRK